MHTHYHMYCGKQIHADKAKYQKTHYLQSIIRKIIMMMCFSFSQVFVPATSEY